MQEGTYEFIEAMGKVTLASKGPISLYFVLKYWMLLGPQCK